LATYVQPINAHPTQSDGLQGKNYGLVPDPFSPPPPHGAIKRWEMVGNVRLHGGH